MPVMTQPEPTSPQPAADWEAFYGNYRKPGYVPGFEITSKLGGGMFGLVFKATRQSIGKDYAIKFLRVDDTEVRRAVLAELSQYLHPGSGVHPRMLLWTGWMEGSTRGRPRAGVSSAGSTGGDVAGMGGEKLVLATATGVVGALGGGACVATEQ